MSSMGTYGIGLRGATIGDLLLLRVVVGVECCKRN